MKVTACFRPSSSFLDVNPSLRRHLRTDLMSWRSLWAQFPAKRKASERVLLCKEQIFLVLKPVCITHVDCLDSCDKRSKDDGLVIRLSFLMPLYRRVSPS